MSASQMFDQLERASVARKRPAEVMRPWSTAFMVEHTGASLRQINYWADKGLLGRGLHRGSGSQRSYTPADFELVAGLAHLASVGARDVWLAKAAEAIRAARVHTAGERLVLTLDGNCYRHPADAPTKATGPCWVVPLVPCPFSPAGVPSDRIAGTPAGGTSRDVA